MRSELNDETPHEDMFAHLERAFIADFLRVRGYERHELSALSKEQADQLLKEASLYASTKLAEVELRAHLVREIHGEIPTGPAAS